MKTNLLLKKLGLMVLLAGVCISARAQQEISGTVVSGEDHLPLPGVIIKVKETQTGTITDGNGHYSIQVPGSASILVFSQLGMQSREIKTEGRIRIDLALYPENREMNEVVVIGYGTSLRKDLTGSLSSIGPEELMKNRTGSLLESLQGRMAGVMVTSSSGEPGAGVNISIRGGNSINAGTQPLYVIDAMQIDVNTMEYGTSSLGNNATYNPLSSLNASDIESIDILKDASATAIYGSRGANGVIIVTTKSGKKGGVNVELDVFGGLSTVTRKIPVLQGQDYGEYRFLKTPSTEWGIDTNGDGYVDQVKDFSDVHSHNWQDELLRTAWSQSYNLSIHGGNATDLRVAGNIGYFKQQGIIDKNDYERLNARFKIDYDVNSSLSLGINTNLSYNVSNGAAVTNGGNSYNGLIQSFLLFKPFNFVDDPSDPDNFGLSNPVDFLRDAYKKVPLTRILADAYASWQVLPGLKLRVSINGGLTNSKSEEWYPSTTSWGYTPNGLAAVSEASTIQWQNSNTLTYIKNFRGGHYLNAMAGLEFAEYNWSNFNVRGENFAVQTYNPVFDLSQADVFAQKPSTSKYTNTRVSQFARLNYTYMDKYLFTSTIRRDGSSKFGENNKYALFPSVALAWKVHNEPFMKNQSLWDEFKIRTSLGATGNDRIESYRSLSRLDKAYYANADGTSDLGLAPSEIANPSLKWETTYQYDIGFNMQLLDNRLGIDFDWYYKDTKDMLLHADIASHQGSYKQWQNIGNVTNRGIEIGLSTTNIRTKDFLWTSNLNFNMNRNKVKSLGSVSFVPVRVQGGHIIEVGRVIEGYPIGSGWGYICDGVYQKEDFEDDGSLKEGVTGILGMTPKPGDLKFRDLTGDNMVDPENDKTVISNSEPLHFGGFTNSFQYGNFDFSFLLQWSYGNEVLNIGRYRYEGFIGYLNVSQDYWNNRWTEENPSDKYPSLNGEGKTESSSYYVEDASYLRIKNIVLGYTLPREISRKAGLKNVRFYLTCDNLYTFTNYSGFDPEVSYWDKLIPGLDNVSYPRARTFSLGCNLKF